MHLHVARLPDPEGAVGGLIFHRRVPPAIKVEDVVSVGEVQPHAAGLQREDKQARPLGGLEAPHHAVAILGRRAAVQKQRLAKQPLREVLLEQRAHLGELREDQRPVVGGQHLLQHLVQAR